jgi:hypothetical protein
MWIDYIKLIRDQIPEITTKMEKYAIEVMEKIYAGADIQAGCRSQGSRECQDYDLTAGFSVWYELIDTILATWNRSQEAVQNAARTSPATGWLRKAK